MNTATGYEMMFSKELDTMVSIPGLFVCIFCGELTSQTDEICTDCAEEIEYTV
jgi:hypothetical protein